jgi:hypothetical protein
MGASRTSPFDVVLGLRLTSEAGTLTHLADELAVVPSQIHNSLRRLALAGLLRPNARAANGRALVEFITHGVRYAFPVAKGPLTTGVPTAYSAPPLSAEVDAIDVVVWPAPMHPAAVQGFSLIPLYSAAPQLIERSPATYRLVAITDAIRLGDPRTRVIARERLEQLLGARA